MSVPPDDRRPILVVAADTRAADPIVGDLRRLGRVAISIDSCNAALEMMDVIGFDVVIVTVDAPSHWETCWRIAAAAGCPVAVVTRFLARDRRYRDRAFRAGVSAYVCRPCTVARLRAMLARLTAGERRLESVDRAAYCET